MGKHSDSSCFKKGKSYCTSDNVLKIHTPINRSACGTCEMSLKRNVQLLFLFVHIPYLRKLSALYILHAHPKSPPGIIE